MIGNTLTLAFEISQQSILIGLVTGLAYAALAAGFVLVYRSTGVLNFAHAETGALCVGLFLYLLVEVNLNWWLAYVICIGVGAFIGLCTELIIVRRLFHSPRLVLLIATIGVAQLLTAIKINLPSVSSPGPIPLPFSRVFEPSSNLRILPREYVVLIVVPVLILALAWFLARTRFGLAVRATASNGDTARVYGTSPKTTSTIVWSIGGALAAATAILFAPYTISNAAAAGATALGAPLLLRAVTVGLIARMQSLPMVLVGGLSVGVVEQLVASNSSRRTVDIYLFIAVLVVVLFVKRSSTEDASWSLSPHLRPIPHRLKKVFWVKHFNFIGFGLLFGFFAVFGLLVDSNSRLFTWTGIIIIAIVGVSLSLLTGWAGQLSLGQFAFVGLGAMTMVTFTQGNELPFINYAFTMSWGLSLIWSVIVGVIAALIIGIPALRVKGLFLAVATLAFAVAAANWILLRDVFTGGSATTRPVPKPVIGPVDFGESRKAYFFFCLACLVLVSILVSRIRRTGIGRTLIAVRENEQAAAAATVNPARAKLTAFALSGGIAAFAGALYITLQSAVQPASVFGPEQSIRIVAIAIIGGLGSVAGPVLGALWVVGFPSFWGSSPPDLVVLLTSSIGLLLLLMYFPGGIQQLVYTARDAILAAADRRLGEPEPQERRVVHALPTRSTGPIDLPEGVPALKTQGVSVQFGGNRAVNDVAFHVMPNELVGLIGTNGAGKSTLLNAVSGFVPSTGSIEVLGKEVNKLSAHKRHELGLGRGFQAAKLYPDLTVRETLMVALEARESTKLIPTLLGLPNARSAERRKRSEAEDIIDFLGLGHFAESYVASLSTGTRRIVELGGLLAVDAQVLLLDEPTGGVAQKETEAFGPLIRRIQQELQAAVVVIEHDMPLVMSISDRVYCLESGEVIAEGEPEDVRSDPLVISSYLGTDTRAIERSDQSGTERSDQSGTERSDQSATKK